MPYTRKGRYNQLILTVSLLLKGNAMKIGNTYIITFEISGRTLTFTGKITSIDDKMVSFIDRYKKELNYNLKFLVSYEEVENSNGISK